MAAPRHGPPPISASQRILAPLFGFMAAVIVVILGCTSAAVIVSIFDLHKAITPNMIQMLSYIGVWFGGLFAGKRAKQKGWLVGGITGLIYGSTFMLLSGGITAEQGNTSPMLRVVLTFLAGAFGGVIGVNL